MTLMIHQGTMMITENTSLTTESNQGFSLKDIKDYRYWPFPTKDKPLVALKGKERMYNPSKQVNKVYPDDMPDALV